MDGRASISRQLLVALLLLLSTGVTTAQPGLVRRLTGHICDCMQSVTATQVRERANTCLTEAARAFAEPLAQRYQLDATLPADVNRLGNLLVEPLADDCPILSTLTIDTQPEKRRWSDMDLARAAAAEANLLRGTKRPPPDPPAAVAREIATEFTVTGRIVRDPVSRTILVQEAAGGEALSLELPTRLAVALRGQTGTTYTFRVRSEVQLDGEEGKLVYVVEEIVK